MNIKKIIIILLIFFNFINNSVSNENVEILDYLKESNEYTYFYKLIKKAKFEKLLKEEYRFKKVLYLPNNEAFEQLPIRLQKYIWDENDNSAAKKIIKTHLYAGSIKEVFKDPNKKVVIINRLEINGEKVKIYSNSDLFVKDMINKKDLIIKKNIQIVPVSCVMYLQPSFTDERLNDEARKKSLVTSCCMLSDKEINNFMKGDTI